MKALSELADPAKSAVLIVDVQNDFCRPDGALGKIGAPTDDAMAIIPRLQRLIGAARAAGARVVFIQTIHEDSTNSAAWTWRWAGEINECCRPGTWGIEFTGIAPLPNEPVVVKHRYSAFINTRLDSVLRTLNIENLIMTGVASNACVESTARQGFMMDYNIVFLSDCTAARSREEHEGALYNIRNHFGMVTTSDDVISTWDAQLAKT